MLFSPLKHHFDLNITDTALKVSRSLYSFTTSISHGVENYFPSCGVRVSLMLFLASYRLSFRNRGTVSRTQTGNLENTLVYILAQNPRKIDKILPVSAVTPPPSGWIQHSVPHGKLL